MKIEMNHQEHIKNALELKSLGDASLIKSDMDSAIKYYSMSLSYICVDSKVYKNLGQAYLRSCKNDLAIESFNNAIAIDNSDAESYYYLYIAHKASGNIDLSTMYLQKAAILGNLIAQELCR